MEKKTSTKELVYDAVVELHAQEQVVTREILADNMELSMSIIDDRLKSLANDGLIARVQRGVYVPIEKYPVSRAISHTELPDGTVVLDVGDDVIKLTPRESRTLAVMLGARAIQASQIEQGQMMTVLAAELAAKVKQLERQVKALRLRGCKGDDYQAELFSE